MTDMEDARAQAGPSSGGRGSGIAPVVLRLALLAASLAAAAVAGEVLVRTFSRMDHPLVLTSDIPGLAYQLIPDMPVKGSTGDFRINRWRFRGEDFPKEKPPGEFRVFVLGDSVIFAKDVGGDHFSRALEKSLNARRPGGGPARYRVVDAGVPSYSTCQELTALEKWVSDFQPDLVLVGYAVNDPEKPRYPFGMDVARGYVPLWTRAYQWTKRRVYLLKWCTDQVSTIAFHLRGGYGHYGPKVDPSNIDDYIAALHDPKGEFWKLCEGCIRGFGRYQAAKGVPVVFVVFPLMSRMDSMVLRPLYGQVAAAARKAGLEAVNLYPSFAGLPEGRRKSYEGDGLHPTEGGHVFFAGVVEERLRARPGLLGVLRPGAGVRGNRRNRGDQPSDNRPDP